jgi:hypothetical protein
MQFAFFAVLMALGSVGIVAAIPVEINDVIVVSTQAQITGIDPNRLTVVQRPGNLLTDHAHRILSAVSSISCSVLI